jgi:alkanesulfonate monooxygenase SsuD/methylene tetrahydromethanopterin reductase-like flavin-dependent oxidoreductase (luciferase family)
VRLFADLAVVLEDDSAAAQARLRRLDDRAARPSAGAVPGGPAVFAGTPEDLAEELAGWRDTGLSGFRLRPAVLPYDLVRISRDLVPALRARGVFPDRAGSVTLRGRLGLGRPVHRYVTQGES